MQNLRMIGWPQVAFAATRPFIKSIVIVLVSFNCSFAFADDYLLTIAGGYEPTGNQASLEANVLFFQQVVHERYEVTVEHMIFFAA